MVQEPGLSRVQELGIESPVGEVEVVVVGSEQVLLLVGQEEVGYFLQGNQDGVPFPYQFQNLTLRRNFSLYFYLNFSICLVWVGRCKFVGNRWGVPRHTKVPLSSTNLEGRWHQEGRGLARGVFRCSSSRQMIFELRVDRRGNAFGGLVVSDDLLDTK